MSFELIAIMKLIVKPSLNLFPCYNLKL